MRKLVAALAASSLFLVATVVGAQECRYSAPRNADINAAGLRSLMLKLGSSDLEIRGVAGLNRVEVRGTACASNQARLKDLQITTGRSGDQATVDAEHHTETGIFNVFGNNYAYLKLQVRVPQVLAVKIDSGSGDMQASSLASLDVETGSGDLIADGIAGPLVLRLGSGDVRASHVSSVNLRGNGSGDVRVDGVQGDAQADHSRVPAISIFRTCAAACAWVPLAPGMSASAISAAMRRSAAPVRAT